MNIVKTTLDKIKHIRKDYLKSLPEFQELYIELMIANSDSYLLQVNRIDIGYVFVSTEGVLIEFFVRDEYVSQSQVLFNQVLSELSINDIYCKSFDYLLLSTCMLNSLSYTILGVLYRDYNSALVQIDYNLKMQQADHSFIKLILEQDDSINELFETELQLRNFIKDEHVFVFHKNEEFVGCGMVLRTNIDWNYCDLGVWVKPSNRCKGIGSQIILRLREFALKSNLNPSCGCAIENIASQKTIEKSGFISKHKLIKFKIT
jgi:predicted acetyltransferase